MGIDVGDNILFDGGTIVFSVRRIDDPRCHLLLQNIHCFCYHHYMVEVVVVVAVDFSLESPKCGRCLLRLSDSCFDFGS